MLLLDHRRARQGWPRRLEAEDGGQLLLRGAVEEHRRRISKSRVSRKSTDAEIGEREQNGPLHGVASSRLNVQPQVQLHPAQQRVDPPGHPQDPEKEAYDDNPWL